MMRLCLGACEIGNGIQPCIVRSSETFRGKSMAAKPQGILQVHRIRPVLYMDIIPLPPFKF